jgi:hypothetical protein
MLGHKGHLAICVLLQTIFTSPEATIGPLTSPIPMIPITGWLPEPVDSVTIVAILFYIGFDVMRSQILCVGYCTLGGGSNT